MEPVVPADAPAHRVQVVRHRLAAEERRRRLIEGQADPDPLAGAHAPGRRRDDLRREPVQRAELIAPPPDIPRVPVAGPGQPGKLIKHRLALSSHPYLVPRCGRLGYGWVNKRRASPYACGYMEYDYIVVGAGAAGCVVAGGV